MARDFDTEIAAARSQYDEFVAEMESIRKRLTRQAGEWLVSWFDEEARRVARERQDVTEKLHSQGQLSDVKSAVAGLREHAIENVVRVMVSDSLWWHLKPGEQNYYFHAGGNRAPAVFDAPLKSATEPLGRVFQEFGYLSTNSSTPGASGWTVRGTSAVRSWLDWPSELLALVREYSDKQSKAANLKTTIDTVEQEKARANAADLWDKA